MSRNRWLVSDPDYTVEMLYEYISLKNQEIFIHVNAVIKAFCFKMMSILCRTQSVNVSFAEKYLLWQTWLKNLTHV